MNVTSAIGIAAILIVVSIIVVVALLLEINSKKLEVYQTTIYDKETRNSMIYTGIFIPIVQHILKVDMGIEVNVDQDMYTKLEIGDRVQVARYSNSKYKIENSQSICHRP